MSSPATDGATRLVDMEFKHGALAIRTITEAFEDLKAVGAASHAEALAGKPKKRGRTA